MTLSNVLYAESLASEWIPVTYYYDMKNIPEKNAMELEIRRLQKKGDTVAVMLKDNAQGLKVDKGTERSSKPSLYGAIYRKRRDEEDTAKKSQ